MWRFPRESHNPGGSPAHRLRAPLRESLRHADSFAAPGGTDVDGFVCQTHMPCIAVCIRIHRHRRNAEGAAGRDHPAGDLPRLAIRILSKGACVAAAIGSRWVIGSVSARRRSGGSSYEEKRLVCFTPTAGASRFVATRRCVACKPAAQTPAIAGASTTEPHCQPARQNLPPQRAGMRLQRTHLLTCETRRNALARSAHSTPPTTPGPARDAYRPDR